jgi:hypothetical protein
MDTFVNPIRSASRNVGHAVKTGADGIGHLFNAKGVSFLPIFVLSRVLLFCIVRLALLAVAYVSSIFFTCKKKIVSLIHENHENDA